MTRPHSPDLLWFCSDQQRHDTLACPGSPFVRTPGRASFLTAR
jgi:hypothetical protein